MISVSKSVLAVLVSSVAATQAYAGGEMRISCAKNDDKGVYGVLLGVNNNDSGDGHLVLSGKAVKAMLTEKLKVRLDENADTQAFEFKFAIKTCLKVQRTSPKSVSVICALPTDSLLKPTLLDAEGKSLGSFPVTGFLATADYHTTYSEDGQTVNKSLTNFRIQITRQDSHGSVDLSEARVGDTCKFDVAINPNAD